MFLFPNKEFSTKIAKTFDPHSDLMVATLTSAAILDVHPTGYNHDIAETFSG